MPGDRHFVTEVVRGLCYCFVKGRVRASRSSEVIVQGVMQPTQGVPPRRPSLDSFDPSEECSLYHWVEVCKLVDEAGILTLEEELEYGQEIATEAAPSEVEPSTAYQHFSRNVV